MNIGKVLDLIAKNNINPDDVFSLVEKIKTSDLQDEANLREIIKEACVIANKQLDQQQEDALVKKILSDGVKEDLFDML